MEALINMMHLHPELVIFLTIALGFAIGLIRIGSFKLGPVLGCLFAGVLLGQSGVEIDPVVKVVFFDLFLFATGYKIGPQFFRGLKKDALPQLTLTVVICTSCLLTAFFAAKLMGYDVGTAAGMLAGAFTESTVIGTAGEAINRLPLSPGEKKELLNNIPVSYAVTYLVGTTMLVYFLSNLAPRLIGVDLKSASARLSKKLTGKSEEDTDTESIFYEWTVRAFEVTGAQWTGITIHEIERSIPNVRIFFQRLRRNGILVDPEPQMVVEAGDRIALMAKKSVFSDHLTGAGIEVSDPELLDFPVVFRELIVSKKEVVDKPLHDVARIYGHGVILHKLIRSGQEIPFTNESTLNYGDLLKVSGRLPDLENAGKLMGRLEKTTHATDMIFVGLGIVLGGLLGMLSLNFAGVSLTLTTSGGALFMGLIFGWLHSKSNMFGRIPDAALWIFDNVGLAAFIGIVGLSAGPGFVSGLRETGFGLLFAGLVVAVLPHIIGLFFGRYVLKMDPVILLGAHAGAGTTTMALKSIQDAAGSKLPVLGYTIPYALGNILLTAWGPVIVAMMT